MINTWQNAIILKLQGISIPSTVRILLYTAYRFHISPGALCRSINTMSKLKSHAISTSRSFCIRIAGILPDKRSKPVDRYSSELRGIDRSGSRHPMAWWSFLPGQSSATGSRLCSCTLTDTVRVSHRLRTPRRQSQRGYWFSKAEASWVSNAASTGSIGSRLFFFLQRPLREHTL